MARHQSIDPKARARIKEIMEERGIMDTEDGMDIVRPHLLFDPHVAQEREVRRVTQSILASMRDESGVRKCLATEQGEYVNIDKSDDLNALDRVRFQLVKKFSGIYTSLKKVDRRLDEVMAQGEKNNGQLR